MATQHCEPPDRPCILVVDDDPDLLEHGLRPHVILIDLILPRVSGVDVLTHIRADRDLRTIPRIVMTGSTERAGTSPMPCL
jgi:response regulator RpfG family c-di-GMP phosphodiesterase